MSDYADVIVVGAGAAGLAAAVSAAQDNARVLVLESEREVGGSMRLSGGVICAGGTSVQAALGIDDSADLYYRHYMDLNEWQLKPGLIRAFCAGSAETLEWLLGLGLEVPARLSDNAQQPGVRCLGIEDTRRGHIPVGEGYALTEVLDAARRAHGVELAVNSRVERLLVEDGRVAGVVTDGVEVSAGSVVIASGGFARNPDLLCRFFPAAARAENLFVSAGAGSRGDHVAFAAQAGCALAGEGWGVLLLAATFQSLHYVQAGSPPAARILVDGRGRRFMDEDASYSIAWRQFSARGGHAWMVFDDDARRGLPVGYASWTPDNVAAQAATGQIQRAPDLAGLAELIGVPGPALEATVQRWNRTLPQGQDPDFLRHESLRIYGRPLPDPIMTPPFYAARIVPAHLIVTQTGIEINENARALDRYGRVVSGLYAAGEASGGVLGPHYVGATSLASALTMGRRAGQHAARHLVGEG